MEMLNVFGSPKKQSFIAFLLVVSGFVVGGWLYTISPYVGGAYIAISVGIGIAIAMLIRCPHCRRFLASERPYMAGTLVFLWAAQERCPHCQHNLSINDN
jgi:hypothetical protein